MRAGRRTSRQTDTFIAKLLTPTGGGRTNKGKGTYLYSDELLVSRRSGMARVHEGSHVQFYKCNEPYFPFNTKPQSVAAL